MKLAILALAAFIQAAPPPSPEPTLGTAERTALGLLEQQKQNLRQQLAQAENQEIAIEREFNAAHPGWHINPANFSVEKDPKPPEPEKKP